MSVFTSIRNSATKLVGKFADKNVSVITRTAGTFNAITGQYDNAATTTTKIAAVILPVDKGTALNTKFMEGRVVDQMRKIVADKSVLLSPGVELQFQSASWNVVDVSMIDPDGSGNIVTIAYVARNG